MIPARALLAALAAWFALAAAALPWPALLPAWGVSGGVLGALVLADALRLLLQRRPACRRTVAGTLPLGVWSPVTVTLLNRSASDQHVELFDHYPTAMEQQGLPAALVLRRGGAATVTYQLRPVERGRYDFAPPQLRIRSPWGLWLRNLQHGPAGEVRVLPNFAALAGFTLLAHDRRLGDMGIRKRRRRGEGLEFHQLREYREGDALRQIDWKATSRAHKLISREYQDERDQRILFLLDTGRRMRARDGELSHFDHSLNAALLLAHVAQRQGDAVGLMTFGGSERFIPPAKGPAAVNRLLHATYDLQPTLAAPDYSAAALALLARERKRALVIVITNLRDEEADDLLPALQTLKRRHLVLLASLRERIIEEILAAPVEGFDDALETAATLHYREQRRAAHARIARRGLFTLDVTPGELPVALVNRYLEIKREGAL